MKKYTQNRLNLLRAASMVADARLISLKQKRGGYRDCRSSLGSTYRPERVIIINGVSMSFAKARQFLKGKIHAN